MNFENLTDRPGFGGRAPRQKKGARGTRKERPDLLVTRAVAAAARAQREAEASRDVLEAARVGAGPSDCLESMRAS